MKKIVGLLFILFSAQVFADGSPQLFGDWKAFKFSHDNIVVANTTNKSGSVLGVLCIANAQSCFTYLSNGLKCNKTNKYPALTSIDGGATAIEMGCFHLADRNLFTFPDNTLQQILTKNRFSVVYGINDGKFQAAYFSLNGSTKALIAAQNLFNIAAPAHNNLPQPHSQDKFF